MANLLGQNIGTNYKGILSLDSTINTPLDATLRAVTDGEGNASPLELSTTAVSVGSISGARFAIKGTTTTSATTALLVQNSANVDIIKAFDNGSLNIGFTTNTNNPYISIGGIYGGMFINGISQLVLRIGGTDALKIYGNGNIGIGNPTIAANTKLHVKGSGSTFATTSLLVQNSAGSDLLKIRDDGYATIAGNIQAIGIIGTAYANFGSQSYDASVVLGAQSTSAGFLPPRMTTTQKNAIGSPSAGLVVYDTTLAKLCVYTTAWETITSV